MFSFDKSKVNLEKEIGNGRFGAVYAYQKDSEDEKWVVKIMSTKKIQEFLEIHVKEIVLGFSFDHPNVLPIKGFYIEKDDDDESWYTYFKIPRMVGSLKERISQKKFKKEHFLEEQVVKYFYDLVCGLQYLHSRGIAHCDMKPSNILVDKNDQIKIGDIGIGEFVGDETNKTIYSPKGTPQYAAPEILLKNLTLKKKDLFKADIWGVGVVVAELCLLERTTIDISELSEKNETELANKLLARKRYNKVLTDLILSLLKYDPSQRPSLSSIIDILEQNYPFVLKKLNKEVQTSFDSEIRELIERFEKQTEVDSALVQKVIEEVKIEKSTLRKQEIDRVLKDFQDKWRNDFEIEVDFENNVKIEKAHSNITDNQLESLMEEFSQFKNLTTNIETKRFEMNLLGCKNMTDNAIREIVQMIRSHLISVQQLTSGYNYNITDSSLKELAQGIGSKLTNIQELTLSFSGCIEISDEGIKELSTQLGTNLKTIQNIDFRFWRCEKITNDGFSKLAQEIGSNLKQLETLKLDFRYCNKITDDGFDKLSQEIKPNIQKFQLFTLWFTGTGVSSEAREKLKNSCNFIPVVNIY